MRNFVKLSLLLLAGALLFACGGVEDNEGNSLQVGTQYLMTEEGLQPVPHLTDKHGQALEVGKEYAMTTDGLELIPYLADREGEKVEVGNEYVMTGHGLKLILSRGIKGVIQDGAGNPLSDVEVAVADSGEKTLTKTDGSFRLPFLEGYVRLGFKVAGLPEWCRINAVESPGVTRERYPDGWDLGVIKLPCILVGAKDGKSAWASASGQYVDNGDGTVSDLKNGLMWEAEVKSHSISWGAAEGYTGKLALGGYSDWRMPTADELKTLYDAGIACAWSGPAMIDGALSLWSSEHVEDSALIFNVCSGKSRNSSGFDEGPNTNPSVLAVRQIK